MKSSPHTHSHTSHGLHSHFDDHTFLRYKDAFVDQTKCSCKCPDVRCNICIVGTAHAKLLISFPSVFVSGTGTLLCGGSSSEVGKLRPRDHVWADELVNPALQKPSQEGCQLDWLAKGRRTDLCPAPCPVSAGLSLPGHL